MAEVCMTSAEGAADRRPVIGADQMVTASGEPSPCRESSYRRSRGGGVTSSDKRPVGGAEDLVDEPRAVAGIGESEDCSMHDAECAKSGYL
jgi:hypothetical protein